MAAIIVEHTKGADHGGTTLERLLTLAYRINTIEKEIEGDGNPTVRDIIEETILITLAFANTAEAEAFMQRAAANLTVTGRIFGEANVGTWVFKNVKPQSSSANIPGRKGPQIGGATVECRAEFGAADTLATMIVYTAPV